MEITLGYDSFGYAEKIFSEVCMAEESAEMIVPDALPDILRIVATDTEVLVRSKDTQPGRVTLSGTASVTVVYVPDGADGLRHMRLELPFSVAVEDERVGETSRIVARTAVASCGAGIVNPRKLSASATLAVTLDCYNDAQLRLATTVPPDSGVELLTQMAELTPAVDVSEKTFVISEELQIPTTNPPIGELLRSCVTLTADETKIVGSKLIFKGTAQTSLLYSGAEPGEIASCVFETEFSQIMEPSVTDATCEFELTPILTGVYVEHGGTAAPDPRHVSLEIHAAAQCVARARRTARFISDAYSPRYQLRVERGTTELMGERGERSVRLVLRGTLPAAENANITSVSARAGTPELVAQDGAVALTRPVTVSAIYSCEDGSIRSVSEIFTAEGSLPGDAGDIMSARAECSRDIYSVAAPGGIEVRVPVNAFVATTTRHELEALTAMSCDEDSPTEPGTMPSLVIARVAGKAPLFIARIDTASQRLRGRIGTHSLADDRRTKSSAVTREFRAHATGIGTSLPILVAYFCRTWRKLSNFGALRLVYFGTQYVIICPVGY